MTKPIHTVYSPKDGEDRYEHHNVKRVVMKGAPVTGTFWATPEGDVVFSFPNGTEVIIAGEPQPDE